MQNCDEIIVDIYNNSTLINIIQKVKPQSIQSDLRQEIAMSLLSADCDKIKTLLAGNKLLAYAIKICWLMATSKKSRFYFKYKKNDLLKAIDYLKSLQQLPGYDVSHANIANDFLKKNYSTANGAHESEIFIKYIELGSGRLVATYYGIPINHAYNVIHKVKNELKCLLQQ